MRTPLMFFLCVAPFWVHAEGRCPPGQYPIGDSRAPGCAPIPGATGGATETPSPVPTGKWETRWGAIAEDSGAGASGAPLATGVSESRKSKAEATKVALGQCKAVGGKKCKISIAYFNQCVALADPTKEQLALGRGRSFSYGAETLEQARALAMRKCETAEGGQMCKIIYSACSMSEFKSFR